MTSKKWNPVDFPEEQDRGLPPWGDSYVRELLLADLKEGVIPKTHQPHIMDTREIFLSRPEYKLYGFKNFYSRLSALRDHLYASSTQASKDSEAFRIFVKNYPPKDTCSRGYPHWEGSKAQKQLKIDVANGEHKKEHVTPMIMWGHEARPEYREFPQDVFRDHLYQEIGTCKYLNYLTIKSEGEKKGRLEKHRKAMEKIELTKQKELEKQYYEGLIKYSSLRKQQHESDLKAELMKRGLEEKTHHELKTFTNRKNKLKELELERVEGKPEWVRKAATKGFRKLSDVAFL